ncbi:MAG: methyltransferase domain-containing protein [Candidatus Uhrbacteria bacterium]|nr:methyltransferase domain-containing protein [Candidatus Uhrbacteria bacterium]
MDYLRKFIGFIKKWGLRKAVYRSLIYLSSKKEDTLYGDYKRKHFVGIEGNIVEVGVGYGSNFTYCGSIDSLTLIEPDVIDKDDLDKKLRQLQIKRLSIIEKPFEDVALQASSIDTFVASLVLCGVKDPAHFLNLVYEALKPGGKFFFLEHIRAKSVLRRTLQDLINPFWCGLSGGCRCNRKTDTQLLSDSRFTVLSHDTFRTVAGFPWVKDHVIGVLEKK